MALRIARAELAVAAARLDAVADFYEQTLGFAVERRDGRVVVPVGADVLELVATGDGTDPFHHFALLVPGDRFDAARAWLGERAESSPATTARRSSRSTSGTRGRCTSTTRPATSSS